MTELCHCPFLQMAAETERMAGCGIIPVDGPNALQTRISAILVGQLRVTHSCTGPSPLTRLCRYYYETHNYQLTTDESVPLLKPVKDGQDHHYL
jgi:hypothetical protein